MFCLIQEEKQKENESVHEFLDPLFDIKLSYRDMQCRRKKIKINAIWF